MPFTLNVKSLKLMTPAPSARVCWVVMVSNSVPISNTNAVVLVSDNTPPALAVNARVPAPPVPAERMPSIVSVFAPRATVPAPDRVWVLLNVYEVVTPDRSSVAPLATATLPVPTVPAPLTARVPSLTVVPPE